MHALTAYHPKNRTSTELLDHPHLGRDLPDGVLHVRGSTVAEGEGSTCIAPGTDGTPAATLVASTGEPTALGLVGHNVPAVIDLDRDGGRVKLRWTLSRSNAEVRVTLRHRTHREDRGGRLLRSGTERLHLRLAGRRRPVEGERAQRGLHLKMTARPRNGIGPALASSGSLRGRPRGAPHDYTDNGTPDVLARDASGRLWRADTHLNPWLGENGQLSEAENKLVGGGWNTYNQIEAAGNIRRGGDRRTWSPATRPASSGSTSARATAPSPPAVGSVAAGASTTRSPPAATSPMTAGADLLATDKSGVLWLYKGTGNWRAPSRGASRPVPATAATTRSPRPETSAGRRPETWSPATRPASSGSTSARATAPSPPHADRRRLERLPVHRRHRRRRPGRPSRPVRLRRGRDVLLPGHRQLARTLRRPEGRHRPQHVPDHTAVS